MFSSAAHTVEIFRSLITNHEEVDVLKAVAAGSIAGIDGVGGPGAEFGDEGALAEGEGQGGYYDETQAPQQSRAKGRTSAASAVASGAGAEVSEDSARASAREVLLSLPGVNVHNYRDVMSAVTNLAELSTLSVEQLTPLVGPVNAKKLYTFFGQSS
jgi:hypothetical protein